MEETAANARLGLICSWTTIQVSDLWPFGPHISNINFLCSEYYIMIKVEGIKLVHSSSAQELKSNTVMLLLGALLISKDIVFKNYHFANIALQMYLYSQSTLNHLVELLLATEVVFKLFY